MSAANKLTALLDRWNSDEGKPYKGDLIDWQAYECDPTNPGCMCAQGQVLHDIGGWSPERILDTTQARADFETARLLNISRAHAVLLRRINDSTDGAPAIVLTDPEKVLGGQAQKVLAFWLALDGMSAAVWRAAGDAVWCAAGEAVWRAAWGAAGDAVWGTTGDANRAAARASNEIQGAAILRERGQPFLFLPLFGFADPEAIPPLPTGYGEVAA